MKRFDQINMVPFIDIVLVLLAIVMTTASFVSKGLIELNLPETQSASVVPADNDFKEISVDGHGAVFYQGDRVDADRLAEQLSALPLRAPLHVRVDKQASFADFMGIVDLLKRFKLDNVAIETVNKS